jgi:DNA repair photolyase
VELNVVEVQQILTRTSGFLKTVTSHSLQPYRGCALGNSLCGVGCYVRHNIHVTQGQQWGSFVDVRANAADAYRKQYAREQRWAREHRGAFGIFLSSSTEPFQPAEQRFGITRSALEAMLELSPDVLIIQSHSHRVADYTDLYVKLAPLTDLRVHISIESDRDDLPGLPRSASPIDKRMVAAAQIRDAGVKTIVTVAPLLSIADPHAFFRRISEAADAVVIDHFIGGDGSNDGSRTMRTKLPDAMRAIDPRSLTLEYRDEMVAIAQQYLPVGVNIDGFAGRLCSS